MNNKSRKLEKLHKARRSKRWNALLKVAADLFSTKGYEATSMQEIADGMSILKGSLYHYVNSKEELLFEIISDAFTRGLNNVSEVPEHLEPKDRIEALVHKHIEFLLDNVAPSKVLLHEIGSLTGKNRKLIESQLRQYNAHFSKTIIQGQKDGKFDANLTPEFACNYILGACNWVYRWYRKRDTAQKQKLCDEFAKMASSSLAPR